MPKDLFFEIESFDHKRIIMKMHQEFFKKVLENFDSFMGIKYFQIKPNLKVIKKIEIF